MKKLLLFYFMFFISVSYCRVLYVNAPRNDSFMSIQSAITASSQYDTVLVYPGTYFENIDYRGKNIKLVSLEFIYGDQHYREITIIDGQNLRSCVQSDESLNSATLYGFTLQNGRGFGVPDNQGYHTSGGGIYINSCYSFYLTNCLIKDNYADHGGGVYSDHGTIYLSGCTVTENKAVNCGGIYAQSLVFDAINLCSVYDNMSGKIQDIGFYLNPRLSTIYLKKSTLSQQNDFYISQLDYEGITTPRVENYVILESSHSEINNNLYVSSDGNDDNDGLTPNTPFKSIAKALYLIASDSLNPKKVYVAQGVYSTDNGQFFPLPIKANISLIGDSLNLPILENKKYNATVLGHKADKSAFKNFKITFGDFQPSNNIGFNQSKQLIIENLYFENLTVLQNSAICLFFSDAKFKDIYFKNIYSFSKVCFYLYKSDAKFQKISMNNCHGTGGENGAPSLIKIDMISYATFENMTMINCSNNYHYEGLITLQSQSDTPAKISFKNVLIANNYCEENPQISFYISRFFPIEVYNCTFSKNSGSSVPFVFPGNSKIINCIFDNNTEYQLAIGLEDTPLLSNNYIKNFPSSVIHSINLPIGYLENIISGDPCYSGQNWSDPLSYYPAANSPLIDAGLENVGDLQLPHRDVIENYRIYHNVIDIGCYEWNDSIIENKMAPAFSSISDLLIYPNPFTSNTNISFNVKENSVIDLSIYNIKGQKVKNLLNGIITKGTHQIKWDGRNEQNKHVSSGLYFYIIKTDNDMKKGKLLLLK